MYRFNQLIGERAFIQVQSPSLRPLFDPRSLCYLLLEYVFSILIRQPLEFSDSPELPWPAKYQENKSDKKIPKRLKLGLSETQRHAMDLFPPSLLMFQKYDSEV
jgi:hypothetical protein